MSEWHKCFICDCEFRDPNIAGYWDYCPTCRGVKVLDGKGATAPAPKREKTAKINRLKNR